MKLLGNIIWLIFGGLHTAIEYFIAGLVLMITIIGIPFGVQSMKLGVLAIWPFGSKVKWKESQPGCLSMFMNVLWFFVGGIWICLTGEVEGVAAGLSEHVHECAVVLRRRHLDLSYPHFLRPAALHHHHRHPLGEDALPLGKAGPVTVRHGGRIAYEQRRKTSIEAQAADGQQSLSDDERPDALHGSILSRCAYWHHSWLG